MGAITAFWNDMASVIQTIEISDVVDVLIVAFLIYKALQLVRETRAEQLLKGIFLFIVLFVLASQLRLRSLSYILDNVYQFGVIALLVVFQPELRRALEQVGRSRIGNFALFSGGHDEAEAERARRIRGMIAAVVEACASLSETKTGALIVLERQTKLGEIIKTGSIVDARPSKEIICNIFFNKAPLHDGAMIVREDRVWAAGCFLPLSDTRRISRDLGTRHRAAIGMSENSDALVVVVSEETGTISIAENGMLTRPYNPTTLAAALERGLLPEKEDEPSARSGLLKSLTFRRKKQEDTADGKQDKRQDESTGR